jgi:uncharacterized protein YndB with AHSA1/START domain
MNNDSTNPASQEFVLTRVVNAPRELVWKAWTEAERLAQWWGPKGFGMHVARLDLRPGGVFHYGMKTPDGKLLWGKFTYREIVAPERLVFVVSFSDENAGVTRHWLSETWPLEVLNTVTFTEEGGRTTIRISGGPINATEVERNTFYGSIKSMEQGFGGTFDQLDEYLVTAKKERPLENGDDLVLTRIFNAPKALVFKAWTDAAQLMRWFAPDGCTTSYCKVDPKVGGKFHFCMRLPDGVEIWGLGVYKEIVDSERIVYVDAFADAEGNAVPPSHYGMSADYPAETIVTVTFAEQEGKTVLTLRHTVPGTFAERKEMTQGWSQMLNHLTEQLVPIAKGNPS